MKLKMQSFIPSHTFLKIYCHEYHNKCIKKLILFLFFHETNYPTLNYIIMMKDEINYKV